MKVSEVKKIAQNELGVRLKKVRRLTQEASQREYFKLESWTSNNKVLCYLSPNSGNHKKTIKIYNGFKKSGFENFPEIYSHKSDLGITIQEYIPFNLYDLYGLSKNEFEEIFLVRLLKNTSTKDFKNMLFKSGIKSALTVLSDMQSHNISKLVKLKESDLKKQMMTFKCVYLDKFLKIPQEISSTQDNNIEQLINITIKNLKSQPWVNCHTDYEGRNLLIEPASGSTISFYELFVIDYQDMIIGPIGIDIAGIIFDHYYFRSFTKEITLNAINEAYSYNKEKLTANDLYEFARWGAIQRNMRILGTLSNLYVENRRKFRLPDLEGILLNLIEIIPNEHKELKSFMSNVVLSENKKRCKKIL